jgi:hypothetical protein
MDNIIIDEKTVESFKHYNTNKFRESALHFQEFGTYTSEYPGSSLWRKFWKEEKQRSLKGYHAGHDEIPGYFYFYLNYSPILKAVEIEDGQEVNTEIDEDGQVRAERVEGFPDFWDGDYDYFWYIEDAERVGEHGAVVKTRGRGYSFKGGSMLNRNYFLIPKSKSYAIASQAEFLTKDGLLTKAWSNMDFIDDNTPWAKRREKKNGEMHRRASYLENVNGTWVEKGYKSEIIGVTLKDRPNKARGKRGKLILWEEAGEFPHLLKAWQVGLPSVQQGKKTTGLMIAFGTGGSAEADYRGLEELFYKPKAYKVHAIKNKWDEGMQETECGFFMPEYYNMEGFMDADGNSDTQGAIRTIDIEREKVIKESGDPEAVLSVIAEKPKTPREAMQKTTGNFFPVAELLNWHTQLETNPTYRDVGTHMKIFRDEKGKVKLELDPKARPLTKYTIPKGVSKDGAVTVYHSPWRDKEGKIPFGLYYAVADPYGLTTKGGESLGIIYILSSLNNFTSHPDDAIVASYIGRPEDQDDWNRNAFMLAEYYNARITPENDRGNIVDYARYNKLLHQLEPEFAILTKDGKEKNKLGRGYGVSMSDRDVKLQAIIYAKAWLLRKRGKDKEGRQLYNFHYVYDKALIEELIKYDLDGNFDRVSALLIAQYVRQHNFNKTINPDQESRVSKFKKLFKKEK